MGYGNFESNLIRIRKFTEDHINKVITDHIQYPDDDEPEKNNNQTGVSNHQQPAGVQVQMTEDEYKKNCANLDPNTKYAMLQLLEYGFNDYNLNIKGCIETNCDFHRILQRYESD
jgi:hypothetical protein